MTGYIISVHLSDHIPKHPASNSNKENGRQPHIKNTSRKYICCGSKCYILIIMTYDLHVIITEPFSFAKICCRIKGFVITTVRWGTAREMCNPVIPKIIYCLTVYSDNGWSPLSNYFIIRLYSSAQKYVSQTVLHH